MATVGTRLLWRLLLAVIVLVPTGVLFTQEWRSTDDTVGFAAGERDGVAYLTALGVLSVALEQADVDLVGGESPAFGALTGAVNAVTVLDNRLGDGLRSHERWAEVRTKIQELPRTGGDPAAVESAYGTVQDLLLGLYTKVETTSKLILDPVGDTHYLQAAAAAELPATIAATAHLVNKAMVASRTSSIPTTNLPTSSGPRSSGSTSSGSTSSSPTTSIPTTALVDLAGARQAVVAPSARAMDDMTQAEEATTSTTLGDNLLGHIDKLQLAVQTLSALTAPAALPAITEPQAQSRLHQVGDDLVKAAGSLSASAFRELDTLLGDRISAQSPQRRIALGALGAAVLLVLLIAALPPLVRRRTRTHPGGQAPPVASRGPAATSVAPPWPPRGPDVDLPQQTGREWSGAAR